jgi:hypothetical protein
MEATASPGPVPSRPSSSNQSLRPSSAKTSNTSNENLIQLFQATQYDDGLGNLESLTFLSYQELNEERKAIYALSGCFQMSDVIYAAKYQKSDETTVEHLLSWDGTKVTPIYCECGISYEPLSPSG